MTICNLFSCTITQITYDIYGSSVKCVDGYNRSLYELEYVAGCTTLSTMLRIKWLHIPSIDR